ncbi:MAG: hypothetical protein HY049_10865 [Acidobacteria bacterium]|nr:hypothetical protein [Acidobacteriota bacterium]
MTRRVRFVSIVAVAAVALTLGASAASAQDYDYDLRIRVGGFFPSDLPVTQGTLWGLQLRDYYDSRNGFTYELGYFSEQRTAFKTLGSIGGNGEFRFHARVRMTPLIFTWVHLWPLPKTNLYAGVGPGIYAIQATSAGVNSALGVGVKNVGDFRFLTNGTQFGLVVYGGVDFFPVTRWGLMIEGREQFVSAGYSGSEISAGSILRF